MSALVLLPCKLTPEPLDDILRREPSVKRARRNKSALCVLCPKCVWGRMRDKLVERYRRNAEKCLQLGQNFKELEAKRALLVMANAWLMLAAQRQRYIDTTPGVINRRRL